MLRPVKEPLTPSRRKFRVLAWSVLILNVGVVLGDFGVSVGIERVAPVVGSTFAIGGVAAIAAREPGTHPERRLVGLARGSIEVLRPFVGVLALVIVVWGAV